MICLSMTCLVCSYWCYHIPVCSFRCQVVVLYGIFWSRHFIPMMKNSIWFINIFQHRCICLNCLFLQITNESMAEFRSHHIGDEKWVHKYTLKTNDHCSLNQTWPSQVQKDDQVESLIISLFNEVMNPSVVSVHGSETS